MTAKFTCTPISDGLALHEVRVRSRARAFLWQSHITLIWTRRAGFCCSIKKEGMKMKVEKSIEISAAPEKIW